MPILFWTLIIMSHEFLLANGKQPFVPSGQKSQLVFTENKGQVSDQNMKSRPDVLFTGMNGNTSFFIKPSGISYQIASVLKYRQIHKSTLANPLKVPDQISIQRIDVQLINSNIEPNVKTDKPVKDLCSFYLPQCPQGIRGVKSYEGVWIKDIYRGIDAHYYTSEQHLKCDYVVAAGADYSKLRWRVQGAEMSLDASGNLLMSTPQGTISESRPIVIQSQKEWRAKWVVSGEELSLDIQGIDPAKPMIIDPLVRTWGTYYGGGGDEQIYGCTNDENGNFYVCGITSTNTGNTIATSGSYQSIYGGGATDAFIAKFDPSGARIWATYYGGSDYDFGWATTADHSGGVYLAGETASASGIATVGSFQSTIGGLTDGFLAKFDINGILVWSTYYGGSGEDRIFTVSTGPGQDPVIGGETNTATSSAIASSGAHQTTLGGGFDGFVASMSSGGTRNWGTYYGGSADDFIYGISKDPLNNVIAGGQSFSTSNIATAGSHQSTLSGSSDGFAVSFSSSGSRTWGTYYGGSGDEAVFSICTSSAGNVILVGQTSTTSGTSIATAGVFQPGFGGGSSDAFVAVLNGSGTRSWGSYYGGAGDEYAVDCDIAGNGNIFFAGSTSSADGALASSGEYQTNLAGLEDAFFAAFNNSGSRLYGSYYGGTGLDNGTGVCVNPDHSIYLTGITETATGNSIASTGSYQPDFGGGESDGFIALFLDCSPPVINANADIKMCNGDQNPGINWSGDINSTNFYWQKIPLGKETSTLPLAGQGALPAFTVNNPDCQSRIEMIIVTPVHKISNNDSCIGEADTFLLRVLPEPSVNQIRDSSFCNGQVWSIPAFTSVCTDSMHYTWVKKSGPGGTTVPGLPVAGFGSLPAVTIVNAPPSCLILTDTIFVTPYFKSIYHNDSCAGPVMKFIIKSVPMPTVNVTRDTAYCTGQTPSGFTFNASCAIGSVIRWRKTTVGGSAQSGTSIALKGTGNIPSFSTNNLTSGILTDTIFVNATFVSVGDSCVGITDTFLIHVLPVPRVNSLPDVVYCHGAKVSALYFSGGPGVHFSWTRSGNTFGIPAAGIDSIPMYTVNNTTGTLIMNTIEVTPLISVGNTTCSGTPAIFKISAHPQAVARCKDITIYLNGSGTATATEIMVNNGSTGTPVTLSPNTFNCASVGVNPATLTIKDPCDAEASCVTMITVLDTTRPSLTCIDQVVNLQPSTCDTRFFYVPASTDNCNAVNVIAQDTATFGVGKIIKAGIHNVCYNAFDNSGNKATCCIRVQVNSFSNPIGSLTCEDNVQISLDDHCEVTVSADMFLKGGPYRCYSEYKVLIQLWSGGPFIDRDPIKPGTQLNASDIGKILKVTILDTVSKNSCWGKASVEDKIAPKMTCPRDTVMTCNSDIRPAAIGIPHIFENCGTYSLTYNDLETKGGCALGVDRWIRRTWTAIDQSGNKSTCSQLITIQFVALPDVKMPVDYNGYITKDGIYALDCDNQIDQGFDLNSHLRASPLCVDDYLLDHQIFINSGRRVPHQLGWNAIASGPNAGHPSPYHIYYPFHIDSSSCWGSSEIIMWEGTGIPALYACSNIAVTFSDLVINTAKPGCNAGAVGCYKLIRTWTLLDWCTGNIRTHQQIIKVQDSHGPEVTYADTVVLITNQFGCTASWEVKDIWLKDNCSEENHYSIRVATGTVLGNENSGYVITDLALGIHHAFIVAEDCCGNVTEKEVILIVQDNTPPTAVCQAKTVVSMTGVQSPGANYTEINVSSFDDGSYDNCSPHVFFKAIRMDELGGTLHGTSATSTICNGINGDDNAGIAGSQVYFDDVVRFCCADVGQQRLVVFRVFDIEPGTGPVLPSRMGQGGDLFGHFSDCMVEVSVQNKANPVLVAPSDVVISCNYWIDINRLADPNDSLLGKVVNDLAWRKKLVTNDIVCHAFCENNPLTHYPGSTGLAGAAPDLACEYYSKLFSSVHPNNKYDLLWGFDGYILSPCGNQFTVSVDDQRHCGQGKIIRTYTAQGPNGQTVSAKQTIWVVDCDPFYINSGDACDTQDDIIWPDCSGVGTFLFDCNASTDAERLGKPEIVPGSYDHCSLIAVEHTDQIFTGDHDVCYVILRKWVVIDWCQYDPNINPKFGRWEHTQYIKVNDREKPFVNCTIGACEPAIQNPKNGICQGHLSLIATAVDSCSPANWLNFEYKIDLYNDGTMDYQVGTLNKGQFDAGEKPQIHNNPAADNPNNPFNASGTYPIGVHNITWFVSDGCGNVGTCSKLFEIKDCKAPTPYCLTGIVTVPMPSTGCIDIWAKDLDAGSFDNCTSRDKLKLYFNGDPNKPSLRVCCEDFEKARVNDELVIEVQLWVEDEEGNKDYCTTRIIVQDNQNICMNVGHLVDVTGRLATEKGTGVNKAAIDLFTLGALVNSSESIQDGSYAFKSLYPNTEYVVRPTRNDNPLNGVSTADIVKIQKHILGKELLQTPYKIIAADVNGTHSVTAADISEIRKLILGVQPEFRNAPSWKFIPASTRFEDVTAPWGYPVEEKIRMGQISQKVDFTAVKMGDVTDNADPGLNGYSTIRTTETLDILVEDRQFEAGEVIAIPFYAGSLVSLEGMQFTVNYNSSTMFFDRIESGLLSLTPANLGVFDPSVGKLTLSWNEDQPALTQTGKPLFTLYFKTVTGSSLQNNLLISSDITMSEYYLSSGIEGKVQLKLLKGDLSLPAEMFEVISVSPNPFKDQTEVHFRLPEGAVLRSTVYDVTGKVVRMYTHTEDYKNNVLRIRRTDLNGPGMYYLQMDADHQTRTIKIIAVQ